MRSGIVGAGAIGGWLGVRLAQRGHAVGALARGATLEALRREGWRLRTGEETLHGYVHAAGRAAELGVQDLVLITLKGPALQPLTGEIAAMIGPETRVVPMMNGGPLVVHARRRR